MTRRFIPLALLGAIASSAALADLPGRFYVGAGLGWSHAADVKFGQALDESPGETGATIDLDFGAPVSSAAIGFAFDAGWRLELEAAYRDNDAEILFFPGSGLEVDPQASDGVRAASLMINALRDFDLGIALQPYLGMGAGITRLRYAVGEHSINTQFQQRPRRSIVDGADSTFAYQVIAGFTMPLTERLDLTADYRYWRAPSVNVEEATGTPLDTEHSAHSSWVSVRYYPRGRARSARSTGRWTPPGGLYLTGKLGTGFPMDAEIEDNLANFDAFDVGPIAGLAVGYARGEHWRFEVEVTGRRNDVELIDFNPEFGEDRATGRVRTTSLMANAIYRLQPRSTVAPYAGFGLGAAAADYDVDVHGSTYVDDHDTAPAYQLLMGVEIALTPRTTFCAEYRAWITSRQKLRQPDGTPLRTDLLVHSMAAGLRYALSAPR